MFIKSWISEDVIDLERYVDSNFQSYNRYNKTWINPEESEKENESYEEMIKKLNDPDGNSFMKKEYPSDSYGSF